MDSTVVITALFILILGLTPSLFSVWVLRQSDTQMQARLQLAIDSVTQRGVPRLSNTEQTYVEDVGNYVIGDWRCGFNARSPYLRCAINPSGPCQDCSHFTPRSGHGIHTLI